MFLNISAHLIVYVVRSIVLPSWELAQLGECDITCADAEADLQVSQRCLRCLPPHAIIPFPSIQHPASAAVVCPLQRIPLSKHCVAKPMSCASSP